ncbi:MAG: hypothetical protein LBO09_01955 [Candidatus Peribacteria bacterium]|jgi:hypothetical protein|nr:hypothetical protein [Candidatus Peribacteria bacterium]
MAQENGEDFLFLYKEIKTKKAQLEAKYEKLEYATKQNPEAYSLIGGTKTILDVAKLIDEVLREVSLRGNPTLLGILEIDSSDLPATYKGFSEDIWIREAKTRIAELRINTELDRLKELEKEIEKHLTAQEKRQLAFEKFNPLLEESDAGLERINSLLEKMFPDD